MDWAATLQSQEDTQAVLQRAEASFEAGEDRCSCIFQRHGSVVLSTELHPRNWRVTSFEIGCWYCLSMQGSGNPITYQNRRISVDFQDVAC